MATIFPLSASVGQVFDSYTFDGESWNLIGNQFNPTSFSPTEPTNPKAGDLWVDSDSEVDILNDTNLVSTSDLNSYLTIQSASTTYATKSSPTFTGTVTSPNINVTTGYQKNGTTLSSITYADITVSAQQGENTYLLNLPAGVDADNFVSITPKNGVNNYLMVTGVALGAWSGVQTLNQIRVRCFLGNGVHLDPFILRVYYRV